MNAMIARSLCAALLAVGATAVWAEDVEGRISNIDTEAGSFVVVGITFFVTDTTDFDDHLNSLVDLEEGDKVEVDFLYRDGKHYATEIELDDER